MKPYFTLTAAALLCSTTYANESVNTNQPIEKSEAVNVSYDKGYLVFGTNSNSFSMKFDGRIMYDVGAVSSDKNDFVENNEIRRARFAIKTRFSDTWAGEFDVDFTENEPEMKDMWISYIGLDNFEFKVGNHKPFFSLSELTTSRWATFMETSMITDASASGRRLGLSGSYSNDDVFIGTSIFGDEVGINNRDPEGDGSEPGVHEKYSYSLRALYRPYVNEDATRLFHVGFNYLNLSPQSDDDSKMRLRVRQESKILDYRLLNTGKVKNVKEQESQGIEIAARYDKFMMQAEYIKNTFNRIKSEDQDVKTDGFYVETSYMILGSGRNYNLSDGEFGPIYPEHINGNLEIAIRYSTINLNDVNAEVYGGSSDNITLALNWYAHKNMVLRLNHTIASLDQYADGDGDYIGNDDVSITGLRFQFMF
jgi:phosphate-selective porin OprO/OprP